MSEEQRLHHELLMALPDGARPGTLALAFQTKTRDKWSYTDNGHQWHGVDDLYAHAAIRGAAYGWLANNEPFVSNAGSEWCVSILDNPQYQPVWFPTEVEALIHAVKLALGNE